MKLLISDTDLIKAKENPYPTIFLLNESHLKPECQDIGYSDERDDIHITSETKTHRFKKTDFNYDPLYI